MCFGCKGWGYCYGQGLSRMFWFFFSLIYHVFFYYDRHVGWEWTSFVTIPLSRCCMEFGRSGVGYRIGQVMSRRMIRYYE